jgi:hypothetical protein
MDVTSGRRRESLTVLVPCPDREATAWPPNEVEILANEVEILAARSRGKNLLLDSIRAAEGSGSEDAAGFAVGLLRARELLAHGRSPFTGERRVVVGMAEPFDARVTAQ